MLDGRRAMGLVSLDRNRQIKAIEATASITASMPNPSSDSAPVERAVYVATHPTIPLHATLNADSNSARRSSRERSGMPEP